MLFVYSVFERVFEKNKFVPGQFVLNELEVVFLLHRKSVKNPYLYDGLIFNLTN